MKIVKLTDVWGSELRIRWKLQRCGYEMRWSWWRVEKTSISSSLLILFVRCSLKVLWVKHQRADELSAAMMMMMSVCSSVTWSWWCSVTSRSYSLARPLACLVRASTSASDVRTAARTQQASMRDSPSVHILQFVLGGSEEHVSAPRAPCEDSPCSAAFSRLDSRSTSDLSCLFSSDMDFSPSRRAWTQRMRINLQRTITKLN